MAQIAASAWNGLLRGLAGTVAMVILRYCWGIAPQAPILGYESWQAFLGIATLQALIAVGSWLR